MNVSSVYLCQVEPHRWTDVGVCKVQVSGVRDDLEVLDYRNPFAVSLSTTRIQVRIATGYSTCDARARAATISCGVADRGRGRRGCIRCLFCSVLFRSFSLGEGE